MQKKINNKYKNKWKQMEFVDLIQFYYINKLIEIE